MTAIDTSSAIPPSLLRRASAALYRRPRLVLGALLAPPVLWLVVIYLGSLVLLLVSSLWRLDPITTAIVREPSLQNFAELLSLDKPYLGIAAHTAAIAGIVTLVDAALAFPLAFFMARVASPRTRGILFIAITLPLWISYLVRVYSWRIILSDDGFLNWILSFVGLTGPGSLGDLPIALVFSYIWLPYMILPVYASLERIPQSLLEASSDLGGHRVDDLPTSHPSVGLPRDRGRFDLHLLPDPGGLHHADDLLGRPVHRQCRVRARRRVRKPAVRRGVCHGPRPDHGRVPAHRPPPRRVRGALTWAVE